MARIGLRLFGGFQGRVAGRNLVLPTRKTEALLAYLAVRPGEGHLRDKLAGLLWATSAKAQARQSLRQALSTLRRHLSDALPGIEGQTVYLRASTLDVDVVEFETLIRRGTPSALDRAIGLYRGDLLDGMDIDEEPFEEWLRTERARLREVIVNVLARLLEHHSRAGSTEPAIGAATRLLALDPFREDVHRALMLLYAKQGRRGDALRQYQLCVTVLQRELGAEPSEETRRVYRAMLPDRRPVSWMPPESGTGGESPRELRSGDPVAANGVPLVGRVVELAHLKRVLAAAWRGAGRVVMIGGEAGIGRTRLVEELAGGVVKQGGRVLIGRAFDAEQALPFAPWVDILRTGLRLYDEAGIRSPSLIWRRELGKLLPELGESGIAAAIGNSLRLFEAVGHLLRDLASRWPLVLILEDLHWADEMSVRLFTFLANRVQTFPLLMAATIRDEDLGEAPLLRRFLQASDATTHVQRLNLAPLSRDETATLVRALAGRGIELPAAVHLADQVWFLSEGNPFLIVEIMRTPDTAGTGNVSGHLMWPERLTLPERVREVVAARLERLGEPAQRLISAAATIGREFDFALMQRAADLDDAATAEAVEQLVRRRVIQPVGERFDFTHHSVRSVVYSQLPAHRRKELHHRVGLAIEELCQDDLKPYHLVLARHFVEAEAWPNALGHLWQAAMQAVGRCAYSDATLLFMQALEILTHLPKTRSAVEQAVDANLAIAHTLLLGGDPPQALVALREAELLVSAVGDQWRLGWVLAHFGEHFRVTGELDRAIGAGRRALALGAALGDATLQAAVRLQLGQAHHAAGEYREALALLALNVNDGTVEDEAAPREESLLAALVGHRAKPTLLSAASRTWLIWCLAELGDFSEALRHGWGAIRLAEAGSVMDASTGMLAYLGVGRVLLARGDVKEAIQLLERCRDMQRLGTVESVSLSVDATLAAAYLAADRRPEAVTLAARAVDEAGSMKVTCGQALRLALLGEAVLAEGRTDEAREHALQALDLSRRRKERGHEAYALRLVAEVVAHGEPGDLEAADASYRQALALATELGMRPFAASCHLGLARLHRRRNESHLAREHLADAVAMCREMDITLALEPDELQ